MEDKEIRNHLDFLRRKISTHLDERIEPTPQGKIDQVKIVECLIIELFSMLTLFVLKFFDSTEADSIIETEIKEVTKNLEKQYEEMKEINKELKEKNNGIK